MARKAARKAVKKASGKKKPVKKAAPAKKKAAVKKPAPKKSSGGKTSREGSNGVVNWNFKLLSHHMLDGFGGMGEGMSLQIAPDGRRVMWLAHESAPKNFTGVDVSDPRNPKLVVQTDLPESFMRSNSLELVGDIMAVAYQVRAGGGNPNDPNNIRENAGLKPAGIDLFDISTPEEPKVISHFDELWHAVAEVAPGLKA